MPEKITIKAGNETKLLYKYFQFGFLNSDKASDRERIVSSYKEIIIKNPKSFFLINSLANFKEQYTRNEIYMLYSSFSEKIKKSLSGQKIFSYMIQVVDEGRPYPNIVIADSLNREQYSYDSSAKLNLLIFWASWCGPCRKEIPQLKKLNMKYGKRGLRLLSISLDEDENSWRQALSKENMKWSQLRADSAMTEKLKSLYRFSSIPFMLFVDSNGNKAGSFLGYNTKDSNSMHLLIEKFIK